MKHHHWLILYDICDPKRLRRIEKLVSCYGIRVQKSVFEADNNEALTFSLEKRIKEIIEDEDFVAIVPLCEKDWQKIERYGVMADNRYITGSYAIL
jgi:CRISPR-associated protein Cas2